MGLDVRGLLLFLMMYYIGNKMSQQNLDYVYVTIPKPIRKIFYATYDEGKLPLQVVLLQGICLVSLVAFAGAMAYASYTGGGYASMEPFYSMYTWAFFVIGMLPLAIYSSTCNRKLGRQPQK